LKKLNRCNSVVLPGKWYGLVHRYLKAGQRPTNVVVKFLSAILHATLKSTLCTSADKTIKLIGGHNVAFYTSNASPHDQSYPANKRASGGDVRDKVLVDKRALIRGAFSGLTN
jgi:hypothetical protein